MWLITKILFLSFFLVFSVPRSGICSEYIVTEQQLNRLESNLIQLNTLNEQLQKDLEELHQMSKMQEDSLETVNQSFKKYAETQQRKIKELKLTRALAIIAGLVLMMIGR